MFRTPLHEPKLKLNALVLWVDSNTDDMDRLVQNEAESESRKMAGAAVNKSRSTWTVHNERVIQF